MKEKIIGILGGMGPEATCEVFKRIIRFTQVTGDHEHIRVIIDSNTKIPDRTKAIIGNGISPVKEMIATGKNLQRAGADFLIIPCITAHYFIEKVQEAVEIPIINGLRETSKYIDETYPTIKKIGLLATSGTIASQLFQKNIENKQIIIPDRITQDNIVMDTIYGRNGIKAGNTSSKVVERFNIAIEGLKQQGAKAIMAGCTEIGLVMGSTNTDIPLIDPLTVLAKIAVAKAKKRH